MQRPFVKFLVRTVFLGAVTLMVVWGAGTAADHMPAYISAPLLVCLLGWFVWQETR